MSIGEKLYVEAILPGIWESPVMNLNLYPIEKNGEGGGTISSAGNETSLPFTYRLINDENNPVLLLNTAATGHMSYEVTEWDTENLSLTKKGYTSATRFTKRS